MNNDTTTSGFVTESGLMDDATAIDAKLMHVSASGFNELREFRRLGKLHVLKSLQPVCANDPLYKNLLIKEFDIAYTLEHVHVCRTLGWERHEALGDCILMEYIDGETLESFMQKGKLTLPLALKFINELCDALQYIHNKQVIHRDLKPANIMITHNGNNVKIIDFGLSDCDDYHILKMPAGTRRYIAPEQLQEGVRIDARVDIYSLGVIIQEMAGLLHNKHLLVVARKCMKLNRDKRYATAAEVRTAVNSKNYRRTFAQAAAAISIGAAVAALLVVLAQGINGMNENEEPAATLPPGASYTNYVVSNQYQQVMLNERAEQLANPQQPADSVRLVNVLMETIDMQFPMTAQRQSAVYSMLMEALQNDLFGIVNNAPEVGP